MGRLLYWICVLWWAAVLWLLPWRAVAQPLRPVTSPLVSAPAADGLAIDDRDEPWILRRQQALLVGLWGGQWQLPTHAAELVAFCPQGPVLVERLGSGALWLLDPLGNWRHEALTVPPQPQLARSGGGALTGLWVRNGQVLVEWRHRWTQVIGRCDGQLPQAGGLTDGRPGWDDQFVPLLRTADGGVVVGLRGSLQTGLRLRLALQVQQILDAAVLPDGQVVALVSDLDGLPWLVRIHRSGRLLGLRELPPTDALHLPLQSLAVSPAGQLWWLRRTPDASIVDLLP